MSTDRNALRIGITGAGVMGRAHRQAIADYGASVVAVHDINREAAKRLAEEAGAKVATDDWETFFDGDLDGIVVATPPPVRIEPVRRACDRKIHLMIEKPPALNMSDARACLRHIEESDVIASVGLNLRYASLYEKLKEMLVGETVHLVRTVCTIHYYLNFTMSPWFLQNHISGGPISEQAIHLLDCVRFILGNPKPVQAHALAVKNMALDRTEFDAENAIQVTYELDNGVFGTHMNHCGNERFAFDLEVVGPHLRLQANLTSGRITGYLHGEDVDIPAPAQNSLGLDKIAAWLKAIETHDRSLIRSDFADSMHTLALIEAAINSRNTGRFVRAEGV